MVTRPAIVILHQRAADLAHSLAATIGADVHGPTSAKAAVTYEKLQPHLQRLFRDGRPIVGICATGILVRLLAPVIADKTSEPPVIAVSEDGSSVVPVLGGHNGANTLAHRLAEAVSGHPAITTASDTAFGIAFDDPPEGYRLANREHIKSFVSDLLDGAHMTIHGHAPWLADATLSP
jgi:cobalt-precorrin 5A hydrolase/precorrin-3B C17-methyltransferase